MAFLGMRGIGYSETSSGRERGMNATALLAYWDIYKNYYANKHEEEGVVIHTPVANGVDNVNSITVDSQGLSPTGGSNIQALNDVEIRIDTTGVQPLDQVLFQCFGGAVSNGYISADNLGTIVSYDATGATITFDSSRWGIVTFTGWTYKTGTVAPDTGVIRLERFPLSDIDKMRAYLLQNTQLTGAVVALDDNNFKPYSYLREESDIATSLQQTQEGLGIKTYQSDIFNN